MTLTAKAGERRVTASAVSPKPHSYRWLHEETVLRARAWSTSSKTGGDQNALNLRSATWSNDAENQLPSRTVPGYLRMEMAAAAASDDGAGVDRRAHADGGVDARVEPAGGRARPFILYRTLYSAINGDRHACGRHAIEWGTKGINTIEKMIGFRCMLSSSQKAPGTQTINGTWRNQTDCVFYLDPKTRQLPVCDKSGKSKTAYGTVEQWRGEKILKEGRL